METQEDPGFCPWCLERLEGETVHTEESTVHASCLRKKIPETIWRATRRGAIDGLRPVWVALGKNREIQNIVFRLWSDEVTPLKAFMVLKDLERRVKALTVPDLPALISLRNARTEFSQLF